EVCRRGGSAVDAEPSQVLGVFDRTGWHRRRAVRTMARDDRTRGRDRPAGARRGGGIVGTEGRHRRTRTPADTGGTDMTYQGQGAPGRSRTGPWIALGCAGLVVVLLLLAVTAGVILLVSDRGGGQAATSTAPEAE